MTQEDHFFSRHYAKEFVLLLAAIATVAMRIVARPPTAGDKADRTLVSTGSCTSRPNWIAPSLRWAAMIATIRHDLQLEQYQGV